MRVVEKMEKYLLMYTEKVYNNCRTFVETKIEHFDDFDKAMDRIADIEAFGESWGGSFEALLEVKELQVEMPVAKIKSLKEERKLVVDEYKQKQIDQQEDREKAQLKRLKEKYG
jgi:hypothetical protein